MSAMRTVLRKFVVSLMFVARRDKQCVYDSWIETVEIFDVLYSPRDAAQD